MNKFVMIVRMASRLVAGFKKKVLFFDENAKFYDGLAYQIKCREEVIAVELDDDVFVRLKVYEHFATNAAFKVLLPLIPKQKCLLYDKVASFSIKFDSGDALDNLLLVWKYCDEAAQKLDAEDKKLLSFFLYVDEKENRVYFQADCLGDIEMMYWQKMITEFCGIIMDSHYDGLKVTFENCLIKTNFK